MFPVLTWIWQHDSKLLQEKYAREWEHVRKRVHSFDLEELSQEFRNGPTCLELGANGFEINCPQSNVSQEKQQQLPDQQLNVFGNKITLFVGNTFKFAEQIILRK